LASAFEEGAVDFHQSCVQMLFLHFNFIFWYI
jgi:hypothetical protein